jgi:hypothetical protein
MLLKRSTSRPLCLPPCQGGTQGGSIIIAVGAFYLCPASALPETLHVPADHPTIQACIDTAADGDECVVAPGTYNETINFLGKALRLRSSHGADVTTIDATGIGGSVVTCASGEGPDTILEGFTITGGTGTSDSSLSGLISGGGMFNYRSSPTVASCNFVANSATLGGGVYNNASSPMFAYIAFDRNSANTGGGIYNWSSSPSMVACRLSSNFANGGGAGMANFGGSATLTDCVFNANTTNGEFGYGGGLYNNGGSATLENCGFAGNVANNGGGMFNEFSSPRVTKCRFHVNSAKSGGGMLNRYWSSPWLTNCSFSGNVASSGIGGGILDSSHSRPRVTSCTFIGNNARAGGGGVAIMSDSSSMLCNCTFMGNSATRGGGIEAATNSRPTLTSGVLWGNTDSGGTAGTAQVSSVGATLTINYSVVQHGLPVGVAGGSGNIDVDPMFVRPPDPGPDGEWDGVDDDYGDLRLQPGSPCINAGDPGFVPQVGETDLDGHARMLCGRVDMGAYESGIGDYDCNQLVNLNDFSFWESCVTGPVVQSTIDNRQSTIPLDPHSQTLNPACLSFDFNADASVDLLDFAAFQRLGF